jgi:hypothetical protein
MKMSLGVSFRIKPKETEPFITHHRMPPNTVAARMAWRLKYVAGSTVRKSQVYIRLCQTIGIIGYRYSYSTA